MIMLLKIMPMQKGIEARLERQFDSGTSSHLIATARFFSHSLKCVISHIKKKKVGCQNRHFIIQDCSDSQESQRGWRLCWPLKALLLQLIE